MSEKVDRVTVLKKIFNSYNYGNLGMFIGAGVSKAIIGDDSQPALNWFELIKATSESLEIDFPSDKDLIGVSLPELATHLCKKLAVMKNKSYEEAKNLFKIKICELSNWLPNEKKTKDIRELFDIVNPEWIITTNYDLVLETILTGKCKSLSPNNYLSSPKGIIPIYHIHGTRLDSDSIIITQDDYIPLFRPNEYRQSKLAMTIRESTVLVLGYSLGDMNVLSALDWSKNLYTRENEYPHEIIQAVWTSSPKEQPYKDENGNIIIEIDDLEKFLEEIVDFILEEKELYDSRLKELNDLVGLLDGDDKELVDKFKTSKEFRLKLLELLSEFEYNMIYSYIEFFSRCIDNVWKETAYPGAFYAYDVYLEIILDVIINYDYCKMPPRLFQVIAKALNKVLLYVSNDSSSLYYGDSWDATRRWHSKRKDIPVDMRKELYQYAKQNELTRICSLLKE